MNLREKLLEAQSKSNCNSIVNWIGDDQARFTQLTELFLHDEYKVVQRAAWPLSESVIAHPELIKRHLTRILKNLDRHGQHEAVKRNTVRLLETLDIPKRHHATLINLCFNWLTDPKEKPAVKASSISVLDNLARHYPDITIELMAVLTERFENESPAFKSRARKVMRKYDKIKKSADNY